MMTLSMPGTKASVSTPKARTEPTRMENFSTNSLIRDARTTRDAVAMEWMKMAWPKSTTLGWDTPIAVTSSWPPVTSNTLGTPRPRPRKRSKRPWEVFSWSWSMRPTTFTDNDRELKFFSILWRTNKTILSLLLPDTRKGWINSSHTFQV